MPAKKSRVAAKKRTHNLGGCATCRRRHVKCDHARPSCATCRKAGLDCGGYSSQIRWASMTCGPSGPAPAVEENRSSDRSKRQRIIEDGARVHHTEDQPSSRPDVGQPTHNPAILEEYGTRAVVVEDMSFDPSSLNLGNENLIPDATGSQSTSLQPQDLTPFNPSPGDGVLDLESLFQSSDGLIWNDIFDTTFDMSMPLIEHQIHDQPSNDPLSLLAHVAQQPQLINQPLDLPIDPNTSYHEHNVDTTNILFDRQIPSYTPTELDEAHVLHEARYLLKHFRDKLVPQFGPVPMSCKSPWETLNWSNAIQTHAELTWLQGTNIKHANKANLFALLGCSAHVVARSQPASHDLHPIKSAQILEFTSKHAKRHMQESLRLETSGPGKAKYKDQLMAIFSLIALATETGNAADARCYLIDAERLVRLRGMSKKKASRRSRLLHHVYTWQRIVGESTFVLYDHKNASLQNKIERTLNNHASTPVIGSCGTNYDVSVSQEPSQLDDFLRIQSCGTDSDDDVEAQKDQDTGLRDIHLEDVRVWPSTLYMDIYGIPEIWLSYVSQTTRVANIMDYLEETEIQPTKKFQDCLQKKTSQLENRICSLSGQYSATGLLSSSCDDQGESIALGAAKASRAMMRALASALLILFYRRIRKVHPFILQAHVNDVISALKDFDLAHDGSGVRSPGTPWPAFIAGSEAMSKSTRDWLMKWMQEGAAHSAFNGFTTAQQVMREVWKRRDMAARNTEGNTNISSANIAIRKRGTIMYSWVDVLREGNFWLMLY